MTLFRIIASFVAFELFIGCHTVSDPTLLNPMGVATVPSSSVPGNLSGNYTMTLAASASCASLPDFVKSRSYETAIVQGLDPDKPGKGWLQVGVNSERLIYDLSVTAGTVSISIDWGGASVCGDTFVERVTPEGGVYSVCGAGQSVADGSTIAGNFDGIIAYQSTPGNSSTTRECQAHDHQMIFVRKS